MSVGLTPTEWSAVRLSATAAAWCTVFCLVPGTWCGWLLARRQFVGKSWFSGLVHLPLVLPPVVTGYLLLLLLGINGPLGHWLNRWLGIHLAFTFPAVVLASAVVAFPLMVRTTQIAIELVDTRLEAAARSLGASPLRVLFTITLPLALPGIAAGAILCFARSLGEFGATVVFAGNIMGETQTLPLAIYSLIQSPNGQSAAWRMVAISVILSMFSLAASEWLVRYMRRRIGEAA